ncbi:hypothetical protein LIER_25993 [Lithospermum erythrorhizon]|uniref:Integrase catalytic domain-containing protein n=1 Tax=Lithospermum erythrorhizon TaxID=34254 RepID=A0AAV3RB21_LITER
MNKAKSSGKVQNEKGICIKAIRSDQGGEFENAPFVEYCNEHGIQHNFLAPRTPQQNGVVKRKNRTIQEMGRTMLNDNNLPKYFWGHVVDTACHVLNRVFLRPLVNKTPYEMWNGNTPNISYFKVFGCKCYILNTKDKLGKFDSKSNKGIFLGYSKHSRAYVIYNKKDRTIQESIHVSFDETNPFTKKIVENDDEHVGSSVPSRKTSEPQESLNINPPSSVEEGQEQQIEKETIEAQEAQDVTQETEPQDVNDYLHGRTQDDLPTKWKQARHHPIEQIIGDPSKGVTTRSSSRKFCLYNACLNLQMPNKP